MGNPEKEITFNLEERKAVSVPKRRRIIVLFILLCAALFANGYYVASLKRDCDLNARAVLLLAKVVILQKQNSVNFEEISRAWVKIKAEYLRQPVSDKEIYYGALRGMVESLGDPHSIFLSPSDMQRMTKTIYVTADVGIVLSGEEKPNLVRGLVFGASAEKGGVKIGDEIMEINGEPVAGLGLEKMIGKLGGPVETNVIITVRRQKEDRPLSFNLARKILMKNFALLTFLPDETAYLQLGTFSLDALKDFQSFAEEIHRRGTKKLVFDLRDNGGGLVYVAQQIASEWMKSGEVYSTNDRFGNIVSYKRKGPKRLVGVKTVILINRESASASELVAGSLRTNGLATLVGEKSFGKGTVQNVDVFEDGSELHLTTNYWLLPDGSSVEGKGIEPNVVLPEAEARKYGGHKDVYLERALQVLNLRN